MAAMDATVFADQVASYRSTGNYGQAYGAYAKRGGSILATYNDAELQELALAAYKKNPQSVGSSVLIPALSSDEAKVFTKPGTNQIVIAFTGTRPWKPGDLWTDAALAGGRLSKTSRMQRSQALLARVHKSFPGARVTLTGHSLGASIAEHLASDRDEGIAFNPGRRVNNPIKRFQTKLRGRISKDNEARYNSRSYVSRYDIVSAGRWLDRDAKRTRYYTNSRYNPFAAHKATYYKTQSKRRYK